MIQTQATKFASEMGVAEFKASKGWLDRFLNRYGFEHINLHGEAGDVDQSKYQERIAEIREQLEGIDLEFIFNMDETGLFYRYFVRLDRVSNDGCKSCRGLRLYSQALLWNSASYRRRVRALRSLSALSPLSLRSLSLCPPMQRP